MNENNEKLIQEYNGKVNLKLIAFTDCDMCIVKANNEGIFMDDAIECKWLYDKVVQVLEMIK